MHAQKYVLIPAFVDICRMFRACDDRVDNVYDLKISQTFAICWPK